MPHLLYFLKTLPVHIPYSFLKAVNKMFFFTFLWSHKPPRLPQSFLLLPKLQDGMELPDVASYQAAYHPSRVIDWCHCTSAKLWVSIEQAIVGSPLKIFALVPEWRLTDEEWRGVSHIPSTVGGTWRICYKVFQRKTLSPDHSPLLTIIGNPVFSPGLSDPGFETLKGNGLFKSRHFVAADRWALRVQRFASLAYAILSF